MNKRLLNSSRPGQSIPLIALIIVVLFGMVGLAVDVGNTYAQQRSAVRASEAASIAAMSTLLDTSSDSSVWLAIQNSLSSNGIIAAKYQDGTIQTSDNRLVKAEYLKSDGNPLCFVGSCSGGDLSQVTYIQVSVDGFNSTYFAKVVGRDSLPIHAQSFSAKCAPTTGLYPFAVSSGLIDNGKFDENVGIGEPPAAHYYDENYKNASQRRVYERLAAGNDGYSFIRWKSSTTTGTQSYISDGLTGDGNMDLGFEEAGWPAGSSLGSIPKDTSGNISYPAHPGALTAGDSDWIFGNSSIALSALNTPLAALKANRTRMILPLVDASSGALASNDLKYHVQNLGAFVLTGYGTQTVNGLSTPYLDLAYVGNAASVACNITNVIHTTNLGVTGAVQIRPQYTLPPVAHQPVEYTIVLDTSGSMNWNFYGEAKSGGNTYQCDNSSDPVRAAKFMADSSACSSTPKWSPISERRIAVAKTALQNFITLLETYDAMQIIGFSADNNSGSGVAPATTGWQAGTTAGKLVLNNAALSAGASLSAPYDVSGGTPSATALSKAFDIISASPDTSTDGRTYKKVVIFLTDGVANYFKETSNPPFGWSNTSSDNPTCLNMANNLEGQTPSCQIGMTNTTPSYERPITAMGSVARDVRNLDDGKTLIYVIALAGVPKTGLANDVASSPSFPFYSEAIQSNQVQLIFDAINQSVENPTCVPAGANWIGTIDNVHTITNSATRTQFGLPADTSIYGYVYLKNPSGAVLQTAPITNQNGQLTYSFTNVTPGAYNLQAFVAYLGDDSPTPQPRIYSSILLPSGDNGSSRAETVSESQTLNSIVTLKPLFLDLSGTVC